jgi:hypothetical protein
MIDTTIISSTSVKPGLDRASDRSRVRKSFLQAVDPAMGAAPMCREWAKALGERRRHPVVNRTATFAANP